MSRGEKRALLMAGMMVLFIVCFFGLIWTVEAWMYDWDWSCAFVHCVKLK
jgi:ABC-type transport system involved in cytochrome c biogenesis permease subunit